MVESNTVNETSLLPSMRCNVMQTCKFHLIRKPQYLILFYKHKKNNKPQYLISLNMFLLFYKHKKNNKIGNSGKINTFYFNEKMVY